MEKPPFLQNNPAASASSSGKDAFPNRPQKSGPNDKPDGGSEEFPNRPQKMGRDEGNSKSVPQGGNLPFKGPAPAPRAPFKLGK